MAKTKTKKQKLDNLLYTDVIDTRGNQWDDAYEQADSLYNGYSKLLHKVIKQAVHEKDAAYFRGPVFRAHCKILGIQDSKSFARKINNRINK